MEKFREKLYIEVPSGYEIDRELSTLDHIILKPYNKPSTHYSILYDMYLNLKISEINVLKSNSTHSNTIIQNLRNNFVKECVKYIPSEIMEVLRKCMNGEIKFRYYQFHDVFKPTLSLSDWKSSSLIYLIFYSEVRADIVYTCKNRLVEDIMEKRIKCVPIEDIIEVYSMDTEQCFSFELFSN